MEGFAGFPEKGHLTKIPSLFFRELLPQIDSLPELKVTLYCLWRAQISAGDRVFVRYTDIVQDAAFLSGLAAREHERVPLLQEGLERAVARGTLLQVHVQNEDDEEDLYFINSARGREALEAIDKGEWFPDLHDGKNPVITVDRPNVFVLYEQNIGPLTPLIAENLQDLEKEYSREWLEEAIQIAVTNNARKLSYVIAVLKRWRTQGRPKSADDAESSERYISGKYSDEIEY
jgi:DnaD/phage-associated family protein